MRSTSDILGDTGVSQDGMEAQGFDTARLTLRTVTLMATQSLISLPMKGRQLTCKAHGANFVLNIHIITLLKKHTLNKLLYE